MLILNFDCTHKYHINPTHMTHDQCHMLLFLFGTACQIYCYGRYCVTQSVSPTGESKRAARRQLHSPALRCLWGCLCEVATGRGPLKQSRWPESNWTLPLRSVGMAASSGWFRLVFWTPNLRNVPSWRFVSSDSYGKQEVLKCFTVYTGLGGYAK